MIHFSERHADRITGVISCFDRVIIQGTLPDICHPKAITSFFYNHGVRIFDFKPWAVPMRDEIKHNIDTLAAENHVEIEFIRKQKDFRKEQRIKEILAQRGDHPGSVHIFSAMESCPAFKPWHNKQTHATYFMYDSGRCLHYYVYFIDKEFGLYYLRIETFGNDISLFRHYRRVEHRDGTHSYKIANMRKTIYSLGDLAELMCACNRRYLAFLSTVDGPTNGIKKVHKISREVKDAGRSYRGFNLFHTEDEAVLRAIAQGGVQGFGIRNSGLRATLGKTSGQVSRILTRLRNHGLIKTVANVYKYYLTSLGRQVVATSLKLKELFIIPSLRGEMRFA